MKNFKPFVVVTAILFTITLLIPALLVLPFSDESVSGKLGENLRSQKQKGVDRGQLNSAIEVAVYRSANSEIEKVGLEHYVVGVVSAEMPAVFELEALKAQALTARTYIVKQLMSGDLPEGLPKGANVTDTVKHQVYKSEWELKKQWAEKYEENIQKVRAAVLATKGQILTYEGDPIFAQFFSTSNGYTENSEDYWKNKFPYLRSVESPWDKDSPKFSNQVVMSLNEFEQKLGIQLTSKNHIGEVIERTAGNRVAKVNFNGKMLTGKEIREKLELKSSDFSWVVKGNNIVISTKGYGHGVGMSQYGANGVALAGKSYEEIVKHYYQGVHITSADEHLTTMTARK